MADGTIAQMPGNVKLIVKTKLKMKKEQNKTKKQFDGFWNGEPAKFRVVKVKLGAEPKHLAAHAEKVMNGRKRYLWFIPFIGKEMQAVEIMQHGKTWYADNTDGAGLHKVLRGGTMQYPHRSVYPEAIVGEIDKSEWNEFTRESWKTLNEATRIGWMKIDPTGYAEHEKQMEALRKSFENSKQIK